MTHCVSGLGVIKATPEMASQIQEKNLAIHPTKLDGYYFVEAYKGYMLKIIGSTGVSHVLKVYSDYFSGVGDQSSKLIDIHMDYTQRQKPIKFKSVNEGLKELGVQVEPDSNTDAWDMIGLGSIRSNNDFHTLVLTTSIVDEYVSKHHSEKVVDVDISFKNFLKEILSWIDNTSTKNIDSLYEYMIVEKLESLLGFEIGYVQGHNLSDPEFDIVDKYLTGLPISNIAISHSENDNPQKVLSGLDEIKALITFLSGRMVMNFGSHTVYSRNLLNDKKFDAFINDKIITIKVHYI